MIKTFEFYWDDLTEECQKSFAEFLGLEEGDNDNYDIFPIYTFEVEEDAINGTETCCSD